MLDKYLSVGRRTLRSVNGQRMFRVGFQYGGESWIEMTPVEMRRFANRLLREVEITERWRKRFRERDKMSTKGYTLRSGRRLLGSIRPAGRGVYNWSSNISGDRGITGEGLENAIRLVIRHSGMSPRQYEIDLVDVETGHRRRIDR